jgi:predicted Rossmann fold flavoprotein
VEDVIAEAHGFRVVTSAGDLHATRVVLATGGRSLPKSGSDGAGIDIARRLGHTIVPLTPALTPLLLAEDDVLHRRLSGVAHDVELSIWINGIVSRRLTGALLWTHLGVSGPVALNASRHWLRAELEGATPGVTVNFHGGASFGAIDRSWTDLARTRARASVQHLLGTRMPGSVAAALLAALELDGTTPAAHFTRDDRRRLAHALAAWPLPVIGARGYTVAEATAGGVSLTEIDPATMESRVQPGLFLAGEMLDVDGRLGGFNFQWAWCTGKVAGTAVVR